MSNVTAILNLIHDTLQTTFPLSDAVINEAPWSVAVRHSSTIACSVHLINGVELPAVVDSLLHGPQMA